MRLYSRCFLFCLILLCVLIPCSALASLRVSFLDTGAGSAALLQADGQTMLIDVGVADGDVLLNTLKGFDIPRIDLVASTFMENDSQAISAVLSKYETSSLWLPFKQGGEQLVDQALAEIQSSGAKVVTPVPGEQMKMGQGKVTVIETNGQADGEASCLALRVEYGEHSFLFLPDADALGEGLLLDTGTELQADMLNIGGKGTLSKVWLDAISPLWIVIGNAAQADALSLMQDSGSHVFKPEKDGVITFTSDGSALYALKEAAGVVIQGGVNLRKEANTKAGRVASLSRGTVVDVLGTTKGLDGLWYHIEANGKTGFVRGDLIKEVSRDEAERLMVEATPKPKRSNNNPQNNDNTQNNDDTQNNDSGDDTQGEITPEDCH